MNAPVQHKPDSLRRIAVALLRDACREGGRTLGRAQIESWLEMLDKQLPADEQILSALTHRFGLSEGEMLAVALCQAAETDPQTARLVATAQAPVGSSGPLVGFLATIFEPLGLHCVGLAAGAAHRIGLLALGDEPAPLAERSVHIPLALVAALEGRRLEPAGIRSLESARTALPPSLEEEAVARARWAASERSASLLVIRTPSMREAETLAEKVAASLDLTAVDLGDQEPRAHSCWLTATRSLPVLRQSLGPGDRVRLAPAGDYRGPIIALAGSEGVIEAPMAISDWRVAIPEEAERAILWIAGGLDEATAMNAARVYRQGAGRIAEIVERMASAPDGEADCWSRLAKAVESGTSQLDTLARRSAAHVERKDLVLPAEVGEALDLLVDRIRLRNRLADDLGSSLRARYRPGVRALFSGESGTGKTLAAHWLARQTGLPLYRVDLAAMVSKYIGETEKNLSAAFDAAQHADVLLFIDEADSLFGARTDVGDSHDRYANAQTNYLLQRIEDFDGLVILATNSRENIDSAFVRRLDAILEFPLPDAAARRDLWRTHLGCAHALSDGDIDALAVAVNLAGGHIRNIVLSAAIRARRDERALVFADVCAATHEEYNKLGRSPPSIVPC